jgi:hypothetical protein
MSQENVDALRPVYEEWGRGNFRPSFDACGPDLEWGWSEEFPDVHGVFRDPEPRSSRVLAWLSQWEDWRVEAEGYIPAGEFVVVLCRDASRGCPRPVAPVPCLTPSRESLGCDGGAPASEGDPSSADSRGFVARSGARS